MILDDLTKENFGYTWETCKTKQKIYLKCDYCNKIFTKIKGEVKSQRKITPKDCCVNTQCRSLKKEESCIKKYGVAHALQNETILNKTIATNYRVYGCKSTAQNFEVKERQYTTNILKYGTKHPLQNKEILLKVQNTLKKKYNVINPSQINGIQDKIKENNKIKYGFSHYSKTYEFKLRIINTSQKKFNVSHYSKTDECKLRIYNTNIIKYGKPYLIQIEQFREKIKQKNLKNLGVEYPFCSKMIHEKIKQTNTKRYGAPYPLHKFGKTQNELKDWLNNFGYNFNTTREIINKEIDLYDNNLKLGIEFCGLYWHSEKSPQPRDRKYHYNKYIECLKNNIRLITIFGDEWIDRNSQVKNFLKSVLNVNKNVIYARKCIIKNVDKKVAREFIKENHIQGSNTLGIIFFGLYYNNNLIGVMSLGKHHRKNNNDIIVLDRLCFKDDYKIIGGANKLFNASIVWAIKNKYKKILSWSDNRWTQGNIYQIMNFKLEKEYKPDYSYVNLNNPKKRFSKQSQKGDKYFTEKEKTFFKGLSKIWDCGKKLWIYNLYI